MKQLLCLLLLLMSIAVYGQAPTANFTASPLAVCIGATINFTNTSTSGSSPIVSYAWDFGDGGSSNLPNPTHVYTSAGTFTVTLVVTDQNNVADPEVKPAYILVNPLPTASFTTTGNGCTVPFDVTFGNTSVAGPTINYAWNFGNGQTSTATNPPAVTYSAAGNYTISLTVTNTSTGCVNTVTNTIAVSNFAAGINAPATACVGNAVAIQDMSTVGTNQWNWSFGNGQTSTSQNPTVTYTAPGTYTISLLAQNGNSGCTDVATQTITVFPPPVPSFTPSVTVGCAPLVVNFTNNSPGGSNYTWNFGNGTTGSGFNPGPITYTTNGVFSVTMSMIDGNGCAGTFTATNLIIVTAPIVDFAMDDFEGCAPHVVQFTDLSTSPNPVADPIVSWIWNFGDGSPTYSGQTPPPHTYTNTGQYTVTLTATTQTGCQGTVTFVDTIHVGGQSNADFSVAPPIDCAKSNFTFTNLTTFIGTPNPGEVNYYWDYGDGGTGTGLNPTYEYPIDTGYFSVQLVVDWNGCTDTIVYQDIVYVMAPISSFALSNSVFCNPATFPVTLDVADLAIVGTVSDDVDMTWHWGDGTSTFYDDPDIDDFNQGDASHTYSTYGTYAIEQVVFNHTTGCEDSTTQFIHITQNTASFALTNDSICHGFPISLTNTSTSTHPYGTFSYSMGNGTNFNTPNVTYNYPSPGAYNITLTAINTVGCVSTSTFTGMDVLARPIASITPSAFAGCAPITVTYTNSSTPVGNGVPIASGFWTFPNLSTQTLPMGVPTSYSYTTEGTYTTTLVVTDEFGCVSTPTAINMSITKPTAAFTMDSVVCDDETFIALNSSAGASNYQWFVDGSSAAFTSNFNYSFDEVTSANYNFIPHTITMIATDQNGCMDTITQNVVVSLPYIDLSYSLSGANQNANGDYTCPPVFASFTDNSSTYSGIDTWNWDFGDGKFSSLQNPNNTYVFPGTYTATFSITDEFGCTADTTLIDYLTIFGPTGEPSWTSFGDLCGQSFIFDSDNLQNVTNIQWDMGDGTIFNTLDPFTYDYQSYQTFNPSATLMDTNGCEVVYELPPIYVINNGLNALFIPDPSEGQMGTTFMFDNQSSFTTAPISSWTWFIGGDTLYNLTGSDISYQFGPPGTYPITLIVADTNGCYHIYSTTITVTNEFEVPNVFTPNGDGINDSFNLFVDIFDNFQVVIVNRWGTVVHEREDATGVYLWDGLTQGGERVHDGVYFYRILGTLTDGTIGEKHGNVTVVHND